MIACRCFLCVHVRYNGAFVKCPLVTPHHKPFAVSVVKNNDRLTTDAHAYNHDVESVLQVHYGTRKGDNGDDGVQPTEEKERKTEVNSKWEIIKCYPCLHE